MGKPPTTSGGGRSGTSPAIAGKSPQAAIDAKWLKQSYFLHRVPIIMEKEGWKEGATFQKLWFSLPAQRRTEANVRTLFMDLLAAVGGLEPQARETLDSHGQQDPNLGEGGLHLGTRQRREETTGRHGP